MGTIFVDNLEPQSGTSLTLGASGDTVSLTSNSGKTSGFGKVGQVVQTIKSNTETSSSTSYVTGLLCNNNSHINISSKVFIVLCRVGCNTASGNVMLKIRNNTAGADVQSDPW